MLAAVPLGATAPVIAQPMAALPVVLEPGPFVSEVLERLFGILSDRQTSPEQLQQRIRALALASFDIEGITRFVAGSGWRTATPEEQQSFRKLLPDYVMALYGSKVRSIDKAPSFSVVAVRRDAETSFVTAEFPLPAAPPLRIEFRLVRTGVGERISDLTVVGISLVRTGRDEFAGVLSRNGNSLSALMTSMRQRLADRSPS